MSDQNHENERAKKRNEQAWDKMARNQSRFARCATDDEFVNPLSILDGRGWLPANIYEMDVLCLASGGGWQSILYAAAGANVTVVDISPEMLQLDDSEAERRGLSKKIKTVKASMDDLSMLADSQFDIVHQPVSSCYIANLAPMYSEIARVIRDEGIYISQHKQPTSLQVVDRDSRDRYIVGLEYYQKSCLPKVADTSYREDGAVEFLHTWDHLLGALCRAGFWLEDLREPFRANLKAQPGDFRHRGRFIPPYVRMKARRRKRIEVCPPEPTAQNQSPQKIWTP